MKFGVLLFVAAILSMTADARNCTSIYRKWAAAFRAMDTNNTKYVTVWEFQSYMTKTHYYPIWKRTAYKYKYSTWTAVQKRNYWAKYRVWLRKRLAQDKKGFYKTFHKYGVYWKDVKAWARKNYHCSNWLFYFGKIIWIISKRYLNLYINILHFHLF